MKFKLDKQQMELVEKYIMNVYLGDKNNVEINHSSNEIIVAEESIFDFVDAADYAIIHFGMVNQDYLTKLGCELQFLYDEMHYQKKNNATV